MSDGGTPREIMLAKLRSGAVFGFGDDSTYDEYPDDEETVDAVLAALTEAGYVIAASTVAAADLA